MNNERIAVASSRLHALSSAVVPKSQLYCFPRKENIHNYLISSLVRNDFPDIAKVNKIIQHSFEAGLFVKWTKDSQRIDRHHEDAFVGGLTMEHFAAGFIIYLIGNFVGAMAYGIEHLVQWQLQQRNSNRFWVYLGYLIDDERYVFLR